jgi:hypothetical protein
MGVSDQHSGDNLDCADQVPFNPSSKNPDSWASCMSDPCNLHLRHIHLASKDRNLVCESIRYY